MIQDILYPTLLILVPAVAGWIVKVTNDYLGIHKDSARLQQALVIARESVKAMEQADISNAQKRRLAIDSAQRLLSAFRIRLTDEQIGDLIEAAVREVKRK